MEIGPILRAMLRNKIGVGLLVLEIAFTMAVVVNCLNMVQANRTRMTIPTGIDEENIIAIAIRSHGDAFDEDNYLDQVIQGDLAMIRSQPGVIDATPISPLPLQGGGSSTQIKAVGRDDAALVRAPQYRLDEHFLETLGLELDEGRAFTPADLPPPPPDTPPDEDAPPRFDNIIVTRALADALYPSGDALGKQTTGAGGGDVGDTIVGIVDYMYTPYDRGQSGMEYRILFYPRRPGGRSRIQYLVRTEPSSFDTHFTGLEEKLEERNGDRIVATTALMEIKEQGVFVNMLVARILAVISVLLLGVTSIGIFGITSFSVAKRRRQIGTRRALGATRPAIVRLFLVENALITTMGAGIGLVLAYAINVTIVSNADQVPPLSIWLALAGLLLLFGVGIVATIVPALAAARIPPAVASRAA
jgi:putative ABC transport system permease protein